MKYLLLITLFAFCIKDVLFIRPRQASCEADWNVGVDCKTAGDKIKAQFEAWKGDECGSGQECLYTFISFDESVLKGEHTSHRTSHVNELTMVFTANGKECSIQGKSTSETWYAVLNNDIGTNNCSLHNLIDWSGLSK